MKKYFLMIGIIVILSGLLLGEGKIIIAASGNLLMPADGGYKDVYGSSVFFPELKLGYRFLNKGYIWASAGFFSKEGETLKLSLPTESSQTLISFGGGYTFDISEKVGFNAELGLVSFSYKEEALDIEASDSAIGIVLNGILVYNLSDKIFLQAIFGYAHASDTIDEVNIKLGGFKSGIGVGVIL
jgi:hypothetical protein